MPKRARSRQTFSSDAERFRALETRDRTAAATFVYGVVTTGVFCRPTCASKRPLRKNVRFFETPQQALEAGFRACKRCRPLDGTLANEPLRKACRWLEAEPPMENREIARRLGLSAAYFQRWFKEHLQITPRAYARRVRLEHAKEALGRASSVLRASVDAGYSGTSRFYANAGRELGMTARSARHGGKDETVRYALRSSWLGRLLVAWTARGVCHVALAERDEDALAELTARFPHATRLRGALPPWAREVADAIQAHRAPEVPLDIRGTVFQERVWAALRKIPAGETRSYLELATELGAPSASRAVARACAQNSLAVVVPCHRVLRGDGGLAGYRWGVARKQALLWCEAPRAPELRGRPGV